MKTIAFFNNKGGVGKTTLVYHLSHMLADMGHTVIAADIDPQANLTAMFIPDDDLEVIWQAGNATLYSAVEPLIKGTADVLEGVERDVDGGYNLYLLAGDLKLSGYEDGLSESWPKCLDGDERAFRVQTAFARILRQAAEAKGADFVLVDIGPNLGAINRAALLACDYVITPLSPDLYSWQGLKNFGGQLKKWRDAWEERKSKLPDALKDAASFYTPPGIMRPLGYIVMRYTIRLDRPPQSFEKWTGRMPEAFRELLPGESSAEGIVPEDDPYRLATMKDYFSLMPMAQEARKPAFRLKPGDGAIGSHLTAARKSGDDFKALAERIVERIRQDEGSKT